MKLRHPILVALAFGLAGAASTPVSNDRQPSVAEIAEGYRAFQKLTESVVIVNPEFAMLCVGASRRMVDAARERHGPHANTGILVYMNPPAAAAFTGSSAAYPVGAVVVKEKTMGSFLGDDGKYRHEATQGVGGMVKRAPGYHPEHGDWEYFYFEDPKKIESGRIPSCVGCHASAREKDHVFGTWHKPKVPPG